MLSHLLLMRHAKSSWSDGSLSDHQRPLNKRGNKAALAVGEALTARGYAQTEPYGKLMLLGHNPGWAALHHYFTGQHQDYPTGACTVLARTDHDSGDWLDPASWRFVDLILPRELEA